MASTHIYGLIGYPLEHSLSPAMHNAAFRSLNIDAEYRLFPLKESGLKGFFAKLKKNSIFGLNVTIPYKEKVIPFMDKVSAQARLIGAVNTIKPGEGTLEGFNTDGAGFIEHLKVDLKFLPAGKDISVIGAGGAARAVCVYLSQERPRSISVYDADEVKAQALVNHLRNNFSGVEFRHAGSPRELLIEDAGLLVNATPVGMKEEDPCLVDGKSIHKDLLVYDLIYNPGQTKLLRLAAQRGAMVSNGLGASAFELWTGVKAPVEVMHSALIEAMSR
jgi:shikimate dehydrogenase